MPKTHPIRRIARSQPHWLTPALVALGLAGFGSPLGAEELRFRNINGTLCLRCILRTEAARVPAYAVLDLGTRGPLLVHYGTAALLGFDREAPVDLIQEETGLTLSALKAVAMPLEPLETLTREQAADLEDIPAVAVLGLPAFTGRVVELDIGAGYLKVLPKDSAAPDANGSAASATTKPATLQLAAEAYGYWLEGRAGMGAQSGRLRVRFTTSEYDTRIDAEAAARLGAPGGNLLSLFLDGLDLMPYAVLRPSDHSGFPEPRPDVILGTHFLSHFVVRVEPDSMKLALIPSRPPERAEEEQRFFVARAAGDASGVEAFLDAHGDSRLAAEASEALLAMRLDEPAADREAVRRALNWRAKTARPERRASVLVNAADELIALEEQRTDAYDLALVALDEAQPFAKDDLDDTAVHHINARRGLIALLRNDHVQARRYLLSAAFGLPKDPYVNLWLGRLYEVTNQLPRAWSRYLQASLGKEPPGGALSGLDRLNRDPAFRRKFSMIDAENLLEGRLPAFVPARPFDPAADAAAVPVRLVELFTSIHEPPTQAAEMAFEGLEEYLRTQGTVFVQYHTGDTLACEASEARAAAYQVATRPAAYFDGQDPVTEGGEEEAASRVFSLYSARATQGQRPQRAPSLRGTATWAGDSVQVDLSVGRNGTAGDLVLHAIVCERRVMAIGGNGRVLHRHVVRGAVSPESGWPVQADERVQSFSAHVSLEDLRQRLDARLDDIEVAAGKRLLMRPTWIDPAACDVVAILQEPTNHRVVAATLLPAPSSGGPAS